MKWYKFLIWLRDKINNYFAKKMINDFILHPYNRSLCTYKMKECRVAIDIASYYEKEMGEKFDKIVSEINEKYKWTGVQFDKKPVHEDFW